MSEPDGSAGDRDRFIPVRKIDIVDAAIEHGAITGEPERAKFRELCRLLGAIYHYRYFDQLELLRNDYFYFDPELDRAHAVLDAATLDRSYRELIGTLERVLHSADFIEIPHDDINRAHREGALVQVAVEAPLGDYREVRFFRRGHHRETIEVPIWYGWRTRRTEIDVFDDVVLLVTMKSADPAAAKEPRKRSRRPKARPGSVLLKYFRDIARADLNALFPEVRVVMGLRDRLWLGIPALIGGIPIVLKLASTMTVLFLVAGFYLGMAGSPREADTAGAIAAISGLVALGGFIVRQWTKFQRQSLLYQKTLADNVYFRNINNNAGIFDYIIGEAEEQECKESFLVYYFLHVSDDRPNEATLNQRIEQWLLKTFRTDVDFECADVLAKLDRLGLLRRDGDRLSVVPLDETLARLDRLWGDFFPDRAGRAATR